MKKMTLMRQEIELVVVIQRPEIVVKQSNIRIEIDGVFGNASVKDGDTVVIYVDVENAGTQMQTMLTLKFIIRKKHLQLNKKLMNY